MRAAAAVGEEVGVVPVLNTAFLIAPNIPAPKYPPPLPCLPLGNAVGVGDARAGEAADPSGDE